MATGGAIVVNRENGVANVFTIKSKTDAGGYGNQFGKNMKPMDVLRHHNRPNIFNSPGFHMGPGNPCQEKSGGHKKTQKMNKMTKLAMEYNIPAMHLYIARIKPSRVAECCEKIAVVLFSYAKSEELPSIYKTWPQQRKSADTMGHEAIFAYIDGA
ncbi:MAG TPA: hypothetical protein PLO51_02745, partial [Candidatus Micrarchaeota archaeon]|nr:hypothetical protein [Candidatus Micrarchaeota archaeon]